MRAFRKAWLALLAVAALLGVLPPSAAAETGAYETFGPGKHPSETWLQFLVWPRTPYTSPGYLCLSYKSNAKKSKGTVQTTACRTLEWLFGGHDEVEYAFSAKVTNNEATQCIWLDEVNLGDLFWSWPCHHNPANPLKMLTGFPKIKKGEGAEISFFLSATDVAASGQGER